MAVDRKFKIKATSINSGNEYDETNSFLFLARDPAAPATLKAYHEECHRLGCGIRQLDSILAMRERVIAFQTLHGTKPAAVESVEEFNRLIGATPLKEEE